MTAADLTAIGAQAEQDALLARGLTDQARLRALTTETFGLPLAVPHLIAKLRTLRSTDPQIFAAVTGKEVGA